MNDSARKNQEPATRSGTTKHSPLKTTKGDIAHTGVRALISAIPMVGGPALELFNATIAPPIQKRRDKLLQEVYEGVCRLENEERLTVDSLKENEAFASATMQATLVAIRTHQREKLEALRNAVLNTAVGNAPDDDQQAIFLDLIDGFTPMHIRALRMLCDDPDDTEMKRRDWIGAMQEAVPALEGKEDLCRCIVSDLIAKGLAFEQKMTVGHSKLVDVPGEFDESGEPRKKRIHTKRKGRFYSRSMMGEEFLRFVSSPFEANGHAERG